MFKDHHYLSGDLSNASRCYVGYWKDTLVAFGATMTMPNGFIKNAWRGHRTVYYQTFKDWELGLDFLML